MHPPREESWQIIWLHKLYVHLKMKSTEVWITEFIMQSIFVPCSKIFDWSVLRGKGGLCKMSRQNAITAANKNIIEGLTLHRFRSKFEFNLEFRYDGIWLRYELINCKWIKKYIYLCLTFTYSEKATKICKISPLDLSYVVTVKSTVEISQKFLSFSEYLNFKLNLYLWSCILIGILIPLFSFVQYNWSIHWI